MSLKTFLFILFMIVIIFSFQIDLINSKETKNLQIKLLKTEEQIVNLQKEINELNKKVSELNKREKILEGITSWYSHTSRPTASGKKFTGKESYVANWNLEFGTVLLLKNIKNNHYTIGIIEDRGTAFKDRPFDVSKQLAEELGFLEDGLTTIEVTILGKVSKK